MGSIDSHHQLIYHRIVIAIDSINKYYAINS